VLSRCLAGQSVKLHIALLLLKHRQQSDGRGLFVARAVERGAGEREDGRRHKSLSRGAVCAGERAGEDLAVATVHGAVGDVGDVPVELGGAAFGDEARLRFEVAGVAVEAGV